MTQQTRGGRVTRRPTRNSATKTPVKAANAIGWFIEQRRDELKSAPLENVLAELGSVVTRYTVVTTPLWDGRPGWEERDGDTFSYAISYEMRRLGRPTFVCGGYADQFFLSLHEAAVWALLGALAWSGEFSREIVT